MFGLRAAAVHRRLQEGQASEEALEAISRQMGMVAQLRHISKHLKVGSPWRLSTGHCPAMGAHLATSLSWGAPFVMRFCC